MADYRNDDDPTLPGATAGMNRTPETDPEHLLPDHTAAPAVPGLVAGGVGAVRNRIAGLVDMEEGPLAGVGGRVQDAAGGVRDAATGAADTFEGRVREKPLQTLLLAGVAGFVIGRLLR